MKLSDIVSHLQLPIYAEVPLLIFMGVFLGVCLHLSRRDSGLQRVAELPLRDESRRQP